jgi:putative ABC transport system permease protein
LFVSSQVILIAMRSLLDILSQTLRTLWSHKLRSFLTMFGIAWGVGSLLLLVGLGEGFRAGNRKQFEELGENVMFVFGGRAPAVEGSFSGMRQYYLTDTDAADIVRECPHVKASASAINRGDIRAVSEFSTGSGQITGVPPNFNQIRYLPLSAGRWINDFDVSEKRNVVVIGDETDRVLFPGRPALDSTILLNGIRFHVIGIIKRIGHGDNTTTNLKSFIPFSTMRQYFPVKVDQHDAVNLILYQPRTRALHDAAQLEVHRVVARNHGFSYTAAEAFDEWDTIQSADQVGKIFDAMNTFLGSVGLVTLALGAIGVINIMLVTVADRTPEIGLRKALGATNRSILFQFFAEGAFLTLLSGGIGIAGAASLMYALSFFEPPRGFDTPCIVPFTAALAVVCLTLAGIVAGIYPARKAALLEPVEALRKD